MVRLKIREIAESKKISMAKLSRRADLAYHTIQAIWHDPYRDVSVSTLEKIAIALGVEIADLFEREPGDPRFPDE